MNDLQKERDLIFEQLKQFIFEIIGNDIAEELNITGDSILTRDLEMDSIEIVAFSEKVKTKYGDDVDFIGWLTSLELDELINLSLNDIVNLISEELYSKKK
jgi:acyl carrier protein